MNKHFGVAMVRRLVIFISLLHVLMRSFTISVAPRSTIAQRTATSASSLDSVSKHHLERSVRDSAATIGSVSVSDDQNCLLRMPSAVRNFRRVGGLDDYVPLYRCGSTDSILVQGTHSDGYDQKENERIRTILMQDAGLVIDLRSKSERNETKAQAWMKLAGFSVQEDNYFPAYSRESSSDKDNGTTTTTDCSQTLQRIVLRLDVLNSAQFMQYLEDNWLSPFEKVQAALWKVVNGDALHRLRMRTLNSRGLLGLNQAILVTGQRDMLVALQAMTLFWEACRTSNHENISCGNEHTAIVFNCVQGKDRTGLLSMLCQSLLLGDNEGVDHVIVADYHASEMHLRQGSGSAAARDAIGNCFESNDNGKLNRYIFSGSPAHVMQDTLAWLRTEYGSIQGYLDSIGFDETWRSRFLVAVPQRRQSRL